MYLSTTLAGMVLGLLVGSGGGWIARGWWDHLFWHRFVLEERPRRRWFW